VPSSSARALQARAPAPPAGRARRKPRRAQHEGLDRAYRSLKDSPQFSSLSAEQQRLVDLEVRDFHLAGVDLSPRRKEKYRKIVQRLSDLGARFSQNLLDATQAWSLHIEDRERLSGLPDSEMNMLAGLAAAGGLGGWLVDLGFPAYHAVMTYAEDRTLRREVYVAYLTRASDSGPHAGQWDNSELIEEFLSLRHQLAELLGFDQFVDYALATRMAESREEVEEFLFEISSHAMPAARSQLAELTSFVQGQGGPVPLEAWDVAFWSDRFRQHECDLSAEELKPYFPLEGMVEALREVVLRLFGVHMVLDTTITAWHEDVRFYWLEDEQGRRFAGLYMDLYVRSGKRDGAWMDICRSRRLRQGGVQVPVAYLNCNFSAPVEDQPSLLTHEDVRTLFHEAGHCLHHMLTTVDWPQINGTHNVEWDAVELPSQLFENWSWDAELLTRYARHYESGEALPEELLKRMRRGRHFQKAVMLVKQIEYAMIDFRLHSEYDPTAPADPLSVLDEVRSRYAVVPVPPENRLLNSFSHIFGGGYSAGYYSYLWAEELSADAWGLFREVGAFDRSAGQALWREILAVGASRPAMESFLAFRGRKPIPGPLLESYGLKEEA
jgi:oligopeptidase A